MALAPPAPPAPRAEPLLVAPHPARRGSSRLALRPTSWAAVLVVGLVGGVVGGPVPGEQHFPIVYVVYGPGGVPEARAVVRADAPCPVLAGPLGNRTSQLRGTGDGAMPYAFPVRVCAVPLPRDSPAGALTLGGRPLPRLTTAPAKFALIGDTGLRVKPKNLGTCTKPGPASMYGIKLCEPEHRVLFDPERVSGSYQALDNWPLKDQMDQAAARLPDVVVHVGDYLYRQGPCAQNKGCAGINDPTNESVPGAWGDNWNGWYSDLFEPSLGLMAAAPWIVLRGDHEQCDRGGHGYFLFVDPRPLPANWTADYCRDYTETYTVSFDQQQFLIMDDSVIQDVHMDDVCPEVGAHQEDALPLNRYEDPKQALSHSEIREQITYFAGQFSKVIANVQPGLTNFLVSHRPLFGVGCNQGKYVTMDWTMQQALGNRTLKGISASINGHVHWFQGLSFEGGSERPMEIVVGNGGTDVTKYSMASPSAPEGLRIGGVRLERAFTQSVFGFSMLAAAGGAEGGGYHLEALRIRGSGPSVAMASLWSSAVPSGAQLADAGRARRLEATAALLV